MGTGTIVRITNTEIHDSAYADILSVNNLELSYYRNLLQRQL